MKKKREIYEVFAALEDIKDVENLLLDILTEKELDEIEARWNLAKSLYAGKSQRKVQAETKVSIATVTRWAKLLRSGTGGLKKEILRFKNKEEKNLDLAEIRNKIDEIDARIISLIKSRFDLMPSIAYLKKSKSLPLKQESRERETIQKKIKLAEKYKINQKFIEKLFLEIITESKKAQLPNLLSHQLSEIKSLKEKFPGFTLPVFLKTKNFGASPALLYQKIMQDEPYSFIFDEYKEGEKVLRYSYLGMKPKKILRFKDRVFELLDLENSKNYLREFDDPLKILKNEMKPRELINEFSLPGFIGGAIGFLGADSIRYFEKTVSLSCVDDLNIPEAIYGLYDDIIIFDHLEKEVIIVSLFDLSGDIEQKYNKLLDHFFKILALFDESTKIANKGQNGSGEDIDFTSIYERGEFIDLVEIIQKKILAGEIIRLNLSQRFEVKSKMTGFAFYSSLIESKFPVSFYFNYPEFVIIGGKAKVQLKISNQKIEMNLLEKSLQDPIFIDSTRSEFGKVSKIGTVKVFESTKNVKNFGNLVFGVLKENIDGLDALKSCFLGSLFSGVPKVRSLELIGQYEKYRRGVYGGMFHYFGYDGNLSALMCSEMILRKNDNFYIQTGSLISADSRAEDVYKNTLERSRIFLQTINQFN